MNPDRFWYDISFDQLWSSEITQASLAAFVYRDAEVERTDRELVPLWPDAVLAPMLRFQAVGLVPSFRALDMTTIGDVARSLRKYSQDIPSFAEALLPRLDSVEVAGSEDDSRWPAADDFDGRDLDYYPGDQFSPENLAYVLPPGQAAEIDPLQRTVNRGISLFYLWYAILAAEYPHELRVAHLARLWGIRVWSASRVLHDAWRASRA
jgi:hypothetical protein